ELFNNQARCNKCHALTETTRDVTNLIDNDFHNIGIGIIRHNVVALARQAEQLIKTGDTAAIDRAAIQSDTSALRRFLITNQEQGEAELARQRVLSRTTRPQRDTARAFGPKPRQPAPPK